MPGPWKPPSYYSNAGNTAQYLYAFVQELFGTGGPALRNQLMSAHDEDEVRAVLNSKGIVIPRLSGGSGTSPLRIMLVDVQNAKTWQDRNYPNPIDPTTDYFYLLVMPPVPSNANYAGQPGYTDMQAWESAWYHAIVDGFGM
jgi:hypothetical protein